MGTRLRLIERERAIQPDGKVLSMFVSEKKQEETRSTNDISFSLLLGKLLGLRCLFSRLFLLLSSFSSFLQGALGWPSIAWFAAWCSGPESMIKLAWLTFLQGVV